MKIITNSGSQQLRAKLSEFALKSCKDFAKSLMREVNELCHCEDDNNDLLEETQEQLKASFYLKADKLLDETTKLIKESDL